MDDKRTPMEAEIQELPPSRMPSCPEDSYGTAAIPKPRRSYAPLWVCVGLLVIAACSFSVVAALSSLRVENGESGWRLAMGEPQETRQAEEPIRSLEIQTENSGAAPQSSAPDSLQLRRSVGAGESLSPSELYEAVSPAVVRIRAESYYGYSDCSGVVISADGYILTAAERLGSAAALTVSFSDGSSLSARQIGADRISGVCLLKVEASGLPTVSFAAGEPTVGQSVWCVCNPYGEAIPNVFRTGMLSVSRRVTLNGVSYRVLSASGLENPDCGSPILDSKGRVLGLMSAIGSRIVSGTDPGFAVSTGDLERILESMEGAETDNLCWLGFEPEDIPMEYKFMLQLPGYVWIGELSSDSSLRDVLRSYDVITAVDGVELSSAEELNELIRSRRPGDKVSLLVYRSGDWLKVILPVIKR